MNLKNLSMSIYIHTFNTEQNNMAGILKTLFPSF
jgi:hypothetical protein